MSYIKAFLAVITEFFKWKTKQDQQNEDDVNKVTTNPRPPKPLPAAPKPDPIKTIE